MVIQRLTEAIKSEIVSHISQQATLICDKSSFQIMGKNSIEKMILRLIDKLKNIKQSHQSNSSETETNSI